MPVKYPPTYFAKKLPEGVPLNIDQHVRWLNCETVPEPYEQFNYVVNIKRTMYGASQAGARDDYGNVSKVLVPGRNVFRIGNAGVAAISYTMEIQYMDQDTYDFVRKMSFSPDSFIFSPDGITELECHFDDGNSVDLKMGDGVEFYNGKIIVRVVKNTGRKALDPSLNLRTGNF